LIIEWNIICYSVVHIQKRLCIRWILIQNKLLCQLDHLEI
jgi:hypothetical protein